MEREEAGAIYDAGRGVVIEVLLRMDRQIHQLTAVVERQGERIAVGEPVRAQVEELPQIAVRLIEHQCRG